MKKILHSILILFIISLIYTYQYNFEKTNPYDPNWLYWDDNIKISKSLYQLLWDKNFYLTMKITWWRLKLAESSRLNTDKFLSKKETIWFVKDFILIAPNFIPFQDSIWNSILYNNKISNSIKNEYANILYNSLKNISLTNLTDNKLFLNYFDKEINYCKSSYWNYPLKKELSKLYWSLWIYEMFINKNDVNTFCSFLYSWYWLDIDWWYENTILYWKSIDNFSVKDFWKRLKLYYIDKSIIDYKWTYTNNGIILNDWEFIYNKIININKNLLNEENINIIKQSIWVN